MPTRKTSRSSNSQTSSAHRVETDSEITYETKVVIVILLLLFVYPLGLIFMWFWMRNWPLWLKILISVPIIFALLALILGMFAFALLIRHFATSGNFQNNWQYQYDHPNMRYRMMQPNSTVTPEVTISPTPADNSGTY